MKLIVGLGNPGDRYAKNRHNVGFMAVDAIASRHRFGPWKRKFAGLVADGEIASERVLLLKPDTYMNESGRAVGEACRFLKIGASDVIAFHDELDLGPGKLKVKCGGGNAGHNGLRSMTAHITNDYWRVRLGIGHPGSKDAVSHFVLSDFAKADQTWLAPLLDAIAEEAAHLTTGLTAGQDPRFVTNVLRRVRTETGDKPEGISSPNVPQRDTPMSAQPATGPERRPQSALHPAGERASKKQSAIADNLRKWLAARNKPDT